MRLLRPWRTTREATFVLAPYESSKQSKRQADLVCDGFNDEDDLNELIQALPVIGSSFGGSIKIMEGVLRVSGPGIINRSHVAIRGAGAGITTLQIANGANCRALEIQYPSASIGQITLADFTIDGNKVNQVDQPGRDDLCGFYMPDEAVFQVESLYLHRIETRSVRHGAAMRLYRCNRVFLTDIVNRESGVVGAAFPCDGAFIGWSQNIMISNYTANNNTDVGLATDNNQFIKVVNAHCQDNTNSGFTYARGSSHGKFLNCYGRASVQGFKSDFYGGAVNCSFLLIDNSEFTDNSDYGIYLANIDHVRIGEILYAANGIGDLVKGPGTSDTRQVSTVPF